MLRSSVWRHCGLCDDGVCIQDDLLEGKGARVCGSGEVGSHDGDVRRKLEGRPVEETGIIGDGLRPTVVASDDANAQEVV